MNRKSQIRKRLIKRPSGLRYRTPDWTSVVKESDNVLLMIEGLDQLYQQWIVPHQKYQTPHIPDGDKIIAYFNSPRLDADCLDMNRNMRREGVNVEAVALLRYMTDWLTTMSQGVKLHPSVPDWIRAIQSFQPTLCSLVQDIGRRNIRPETVISLRRNVPKLVTGCWGFLKDIFSYSNIGMSYASLEARAKNGDPKMLLELVRIHKPSMYEPWAKKMVGDMKGKDADWITIELGKTLKKPILEKRNIRLKDLIAAAFFWVVSDFKANYRQMREFLDELYPKERHDEGLIQKLFSSYKISLRNIRKSN